MRKSSLVSASCLGALTVFSAACGSPGDAAGGGSKNVGDDFAPLVESGPRSTNDACVTSAASAALQKVNLIFMYDRSGSMGDTGSSPPFDPTERWIPVGAGMKAFFTDERSQSLSASLGFFPQGSDVASSCAAAYSRPVVPLTQIGNGAPFISAIEKTSPRGGTPTLPALEGAIAYAKQVAAERPDERAAIVLVTDGEPGFMINNEAAPGCTDNDVTHVALAAADAFKGTPSIPTYVIGVGPSLGNLNRIAASGGTKAASMVSVSDPAKTATTFQAALEKVRGDVLSCNLALPKAPEGKLLDVEAINVGFTTGSGEEILSYNKDCAGAGWRYDNRAAPTSIELCPATCDAAQAQAQSQLTIALGCKTKGDVR